MTSEMPDKVFLIVVIIDAIKGLFHLHSRQFKFQLIHILNQSALDSTEPVSHFSTAKEISVKAAFF